VFRIDGCAIGVFCFIRFVVLWSLSVCDIRKEFLIGLRNAFSLCTCSGTWTCMKMVAKNLGILLFQLCLGAFFFFFRTSTNPVCCSLHQISPMDMVMRDHST